MEQLTKDELLAKAKEMYPIGTKFISPIGGHECTIIDDTVKFIYSESDFIYLSGGHTGRGNRVYEKGKWAEIISAPKQHDGYIVPFDIPSESLKKGDVLRHKHGLDDDMFENIVVLNSSYCLPPEWVETWEKHYPEQTEQTAKPDYTKVIELIEGEIEERRFNIENNLKDEHYGLANVNKHKINQLNLILTKIKAI